MNAFNNQNIRAAISSLNDDETSMANEIYELTLKLEAALEPYHSNAALSPDLLNNLSSLDSCIDNALSKAVQKETAAIGKIENALAKHVKPS